MIRKLNHKKFNLLVRESLSL